MLKNCESCGRPFNAQRAAARFCGDTCKKRAQRGTPVVGIVPPPADDDTPIPAPALIESVRSTLDASSVLETVAGQQALIFAAMLSQPQTGQAAAALSKQLQALVADALASVTRQDQMDEVTRRRDEKLRAAGRA